MAGKLFLRTFGCQMNEYDSRMIADLLGAAEGLRAGSAARRRRRDRVQHLLGAREGAGKGVRRPRPRPAPEGRQPAPDDRRRRLRRQPGRRRHRRARALRRRRVRPADPAPAAGAARAPPRERRAAGGRELSRDREVRPPAAARVEGGRRLRLDHGGLQQVLQLLRGALHARRRGVAARSTTCSPRSPAWPRRA